MLSIFQDTNLRWLQRACVDNPCDNTSTCQSGFTDEGYRCLRTTAFRSQTYDEGKLYDQDWQIRALPLLILIESQESELI